MRLILPVMLNLLPGRLATRLATTILLCGAALTLPGCGGGGGGGVAPNFEGTMGTAAPETGPATKIVAVPGTARAMVALFPDGRAYYSPDGFNLGGGGSTIPAYSGALRVKDVVPVRNGVTALMSDGSAYFSPDGKNLGGGGATVRAYTGDLTIASLTPVGSGIDASFDNGGAVYFSPDGVNLGGGGASVLAYPGGGSILQIVPVGPGDAVVTLFADGRAFYSPDNRHLGGGGSTVAAAAPGEVSRLVKVGGGVLAELGNGAVRLSADGRDLGGGVGVAVWNMLPDAPFAARDSAHGAIFAGRLWMSGGFADPDVEQDCFSTCSFFDLWSSLDLSGAEWNPQPTFATATTPNPRDVDASAANGEPAEPPPTDFYDAYSALVVWNGELTAIGATVWRSADGVNWQRNTLADGVTTAPGPLPIRATENTRAVVLDNALFLVQPDTGDVYRSTDGRAEAWTELGAIPGFVPRCGAAVFVLQGRIWIEGGGACDYTQVYNDIWSSTDGVAWTRGAAPAAWQPRMWPCVATSDDGIVWLATGYAPTDWNRVSAGNPVVRYGANHSDAWYSRDGVEWKQFKADFGSGLQDDTTLEPRHAPTCFVTGDPARGMQLLIVAGSGGPLPNGFNAQVLNSVRSLAVPSAAQLP